MDPGDLASGSDRQFVAAQTLKVATKVGRAITSASCPRLSECKSIAGPFSVSKYLHQQLNTDSVHVFKY